MNALLLTQSNHFTYTTVPTPTPGPNDVLVNVKACGICGSDVHGMDGSTGRRKPPLIMGHEAAGIVHQVGPNVTNAKPGDRVTFDSTISCGHCEYCKRGDVNLCNNRRVLGVSCDEYRRDGAMAQFVTLPQHILYRLPENLSFQHAAMVEPLAIAAHAVSRTQVVTTGTAVVIGAGIIGLLTLQVLRLKGWPTVIAVDLDDDKLNLAKKLGAAHTINSKQQDPVKEILELTNANGAHAAFEAVGIEPTVNAACKSVQKAGHVILIGNVTPTVNIPLQTIVTRQITLHGSCASAGEYPACIEMLANNQIDVDTLITATAPLAEGNTWFQRLHAGEKGLMKIILTPNP